LFIRDITNKNNLHDRLNKEVGSLGNTVLVIDGTTLDTILSSDKLEKEFFEVAAACPAVCVCRCSPTQKAIIVKKIKFLTNLRTASVGDGGNDVAMIQEADVGIGIVGKEGMQASLAADFSISQFSHL
jgi:phospholipid-translocating ATPase